jgi:hypothetical protein
MEAASKSPDELQQFSELQISPFRGRSVFCNFTVSPQCPAAETRSEIRHSTSIVDGTDLLRIVQSLLPSGTQLLSVWLWPAVGNTQQVIFRRVPAERIKLDCHRIEKFAAVADFYMAECLRYAPVAAEAQFQCSVVYINA